MENFDVNSEAFMGLELLNNKMRTPEIVHTPEERAEILKHNEHLRSEMTDDEIIAFSDQLDREDDFDDDSYPSEVNLDSSEKLPF